MVGGSESALLPRGASDPAAAAVAVIRAHLGVAQPDVAAVRSACVALRGVLATWPGRASAVQAELGALLRVSPNAAAAEVFAFLLERSRGEGGAEAVLALLVRSARAELAAAALSELEAGLPAGRVRPSGALVQAVAAQVSRASELPAGQLERVSRLVLEALVVEVGAGGVAELLVPEQGEAVRSLAAWLLDGAGAPASAATARLVLGSEAYDVLAAHLAFTRVTHGELVALTSGRERCACAAAVARARGVLGAAALDRALAELRWPALVHGLEVEPVVALEVAGGVPLLVRPAEAELVESVTRSVRRLWSGQLLTAYGAAAGGVGSGEGGTAADAEAVRRFRRYNVRHAELLAELLEVAPVTRGKVGRILALLDEVVRDYALLFGGQDGEAGAVAAVYRTLRAPLADVSAQDSADEVVPLELARQVQRFEDPASLAEVSTLHGLKRFLHQRGLRYALQRFRAGAQAERTVDLLLLRDGEAPRLVRRLRYAELEPQPTSHAAPLAVRLLVRGMRRHLLYGGATFPSVLALLYGTEVQVYVQYRNHPAFVRFDLSPPARGGMVDLEYYAVSQYELAQHPAREVPAIRTVLRALGYYVSLDGVRLHARYDKEAAVDTGDLLEHAAGLCALLPHLMDLDWTVGSLDLAPAARERVAEAWADVFRRLHALPLDLLLTTDRCGVVQRVERSPLGERVVAWDGVEPYRAAERARLPAALGGDVSRELSRRGLDQLVSAAVLAPDPLSFELRVLAPVRAALERGEAEEIGGRLAGAPGTRFEREHEADHLARLLLGGGAALRDACALALRLRPLERQLRPRATGSINGWRVERAALFLDGERVCLALLRDPDGVACAASAARDGVWYRVRRGRGRSWRSAGTIPSDVVVRRLLADNYLAPDRELAAASAEIEAPGLLQARLHAERVLPSADGGAARAVPGIAGSPGRATGTVRIRAGELPDVDGGVLTAPDLGPRDAPLLRTAAAVVTTAGGILSHLGLLALELGRPSLVVNGEWRFSATASPVLALPRLEWQAAAHELEGLHVVRRTTFAERVELVRDGDLVVVDADAGELRLLGPDRTALALHELLRALHSVLDPHSQHTFADPLVARGERIRIMHQLEKLVMRLSRPELAEHLVLELAVGELAQDARAVPERARLLALLEGNPEVSAAAHAARERLVQRLAREPLRLEHELRQTLHECGTLELLFLRLRLRRAHQRLADVQRLAERPAEAAARDDVDTAVGERLRERRRELLLRAAEVAPGALWQLRPLLGELAVLERLLPSAAQAETERSRLDTHLAAFAASARTAHATAFTLSAGDAGPELAPLVGFKAANLGECVRLLGSTAVPPFFAITDHAFRTALASPVAGATTLERVLAGLLQSARPRTSTEWEQLAAAVRALWCDVVLPDPLVAALLAGYRELARSGVLPYVAVRSSTYEEDAPDAAWAGQFDTFLCVNGEEALLRHVRLAWAGLWSARALQRRAALAHAGRGPGGGIVVQAMVDARVAGVLQTVRTTAGRLRELVIDAGLGLGEGVVSGAVEVDEIRVRRPCREGAPLQLQYRVGDKRECIRFDTARGQGTRREETRFHERLRAALEYVEIEELVRASLALERGYGHPLEIEFAFAGPHPLILQARPIPLFHAALRETLAQAPLVDAARTRSEP